MMDKMDKVFQKFTDVEHKLHTINGLMIAQIICQRHFLDAFDTHSSSQVVSMIMQDIAETMEELSKPE